MNPSDDTLRALLDGTLPPAEESALEQQIESDPALRSRLESLAGVDGLPTSLFKTPQSTIDGDPTLTRTLFDLISGGLPTDALHEESELDPAAAFGLPHPQSPPGTIATLGDYDISACTGQGGMGIVFHALDRGLQRDVAIKVLAPALAASPAARTRFIREARAVAAVTHPNVLPIFAVDQSGSLPYFVMPFAEGESIEQRLRSSGKIPFSEVIETGSSVAAGLSAVHEAGLIHRDIKPANILTGSGENGATHVWLADFGIARPLGTESDITRTGAVAGTPHYTAPEAADDAEADTRADLFSLGVVLYEMATGRRPFAGKSSLSILRSIATDDPAPPSSLVPEIPRSFDTLVLQLLAKDPLGRPASAAEVKEAISRMLPESRQKKSAPWKWIIAGAAIITAGILAKSLTSPPAPALPTDLREAVAASKAGTTVQSSAPIVTSNGNTPYLTVTRDLTLQGVQILEHSTRADTETPLITVESGHLTLDVCTLRRTGRMRRLRDGAPLVSLLPGTSLTLKGSVFITNSCSAIRAAGGSSITVDRSFIGVPIFCELARSTPDTAVELTLSQSTIAGIFGIAIPPNEGEAPDLVARTNQSALILPGGLIWSPRRTPEEIASSITWSGSRNVFDPTAPFTNASMPRRGITLPGIGSSLEEWVSLPGITEENSLTVENNFAEIVVDHRGRIHELDPIPLPTHFVETHPDIGFPQKEK